MRNIIIKNPEGFLHMDPVVLPPMTPGMAKYGSSQMAGLMQRADLRVKILPNYTDSMREAWSSALRAKVEASEAKRKADSMVYVDRDFEDWK